MSEEFAIEVTNVYKRFHRGREVNQTMKSFMLNKIMGRSRKEAFFALNNVNFTVKKGETLGIIGGNGAGKSTLLSLIAGTALPTEGHIRTQGRISSLLELGAGFHPDLTGRENVFLNASILGMTRRETEKRFDEIANLSGIRDALDTSVKYYSSGMYVRLGFAVAVMCDPDVLLMDEVLAVGDEAFRKTSLDRIHRFKMEGKTMLIVSHDLETIKKMSDRVLFLDKGTVKGIGDSNLMVDQYRNLSVYQEGNVTVKEFGSREITIERIEFFQKGRPVTTGEFIGGEGVQVELSLKQEKKVDNWVLGFSLSDNLGNCLAGTNTHIESVPTLNRQGCHRVRIHFDSMNLSRGCYYMSFALHSEDHAMHYHRIENKFALQFNYPRETAGFLHQPCRFEMMGDA